MKPPRPLLFPVTLDLADRPVLLVGGGKVAYRKARALAGTGCRMTVVAPETLPAFRAWLRGSPHALRQRAYRPGEAADYFLVVSATDDEETNRRVFEDAREAGRLVNVVDRPALCNLHVPSVLRRGDLQVAVSTSGRVPALARQVRLQIEALLPEDYGPLVEVLAEIRARMRRVIPTPAARKRILERILASGAVRRFLAGERGPLERMREGWKRAKKKGP